MAEQQPNEALEKLSRGIQESRQMVQQQTMKLAQDYFGDSVKDLEKQIQQSRSTLEDLPDQIPGGRDESFQMLFQELMDNYGRIEECLNEARNNVANLDTQQLIRQGEIDASDAARREARELGVDLSQIEGTGSGGRIIIDDVRNAAEESDGAAQQVQETAEQAQGAVGQTAQSVQDTAGQAVQGAQNVAGQAAEQARGAGTDEEVDASDAARRRAEELGVDLSQVEGSGADGRIVIWDVEEAAQRQQETAGGAGRVVGQALDTAQQATDQVADTAGQVTQSAGGQQEDGGLKATNAARRKAEELGVDLSDVEGTGAGGLITIKDVLQQR